MRVGDGVGQCGVGRFVGHSQTLLKVRLSKSGSVRTDFPITSGNTSLVGTYI